MRAAGGSRTVFATSASRPHSTVRIACLRSSIASRSAAANLARTRPTSSLFSGVCSCTGGFGGGGAAGFGGAAAGGAAAGGLAWGGGVGGGPPRGLVAAGPAGGRCFFGLFGH